MFEPALSSFRTSSNLPPLAAAISKRVLPACAPEGESVTRGIVALSAEQARGAPLDELRQASTPTQAEPPLS
jgi:hypothetical protein